jgi:hypothetical protein
MAPREESRVSAAAGVAVGAMLVAGCSAVTIAHFCNDKEVSTT